LSPRGDFPDIHGPGLILVCTICFRSIFFRVFSFFFFVIFQGSIACVLSHVCASTGFSSFPSFFFLIAHSAFFPQAIFFLSMPRADLTAFRFAVDPSVALSIPFSFFLFSLTSCALVHPTPEIPCRLVFLRSSSCHFTKANRACSFPLHLRSQHFRAATIF